MARTGDSANVRGDGTIVLPVAPPNPNTTQLLATRLHGHTTSDRWLPDGIHSELDELRERHLTLRERCLAEIEKVHTLQAKFRAEDIRRSAVVEEADRLGLPEPVEDGRPRTASASRGSRTPTHASGGRPASWPTTPIR
jgi:hypothetical protein